MMEIIGVRCPFCMAEFWSENDVVKDEYKTNCPNCKKEAIFRNKCLKNCEVSTFIIWSEDLIKIGDDK